MNRILVIFLSIVFTGLVLQSCGAKDSKTADSSKSEANEEEMIDQQSESQIPYELIPLRYKSVAGYNKGEWCNALYLAVKQDGKFVAFDNDADYSGLAKESSLFHAISWSQGFSGFSDDDKKTLAHLAQQYLRDKSKIREHELFTYIDKAYYNWSEYFSGDYYLKDRRYHYHSYTNGVQSYWGNLLLFTCQTPEKYHLEEELQTLDGEIVPEYALLLKI